MVKTQIQIPDGLCKRLKRLADEQEWSFAETLRRGAELLLAARPMPGSQDPAAWRLEPPVNTRLRKEPFATEDWRLEANLGVDPRDLAGH
ncbi:MAG: antitoxin [Verrucomicrobiota bacterium]